MKNALIKYLIYAIGLPACGFVFMFLLRPVTEGAHDGGFLGMMFGLVVGQVIFTLWLQNYKLYYRILAGLLIAAVTIPFSFWVINIIRDIYDPTDENGFRLPNEDLNKKLEWVIFSVLIISSIAAQEILRRISRKKIEDDPAI